MGLFDKVKGAMNIGGAKLSLEAPNVVQNGETIEIKVSVLGGKLEQIITGVEVVVNQRDSWTETKLGGERNQKWKDTILAKKENTEKFTLTPGENKEFIFSIPVNAISGGSDQEGMLGTLAKLNNMAQSKKHEWHIKAQAKIEESIDASEKSDLTVQF
ncbi:MAG: sporulation protein [bacterium]|nr:sporulation protein [bacterium]